MEAVNTNQVSAGLAVLAFVALAAGIASLVLAALPKSKWPASLQHNFRPLLLPVALGIAAVAMVGSLYYSEVAGYTPCELCWYQRICMYPLVAVLAIALIRRDRAGGLYALPLTVVGLGLSIYHYRLQLSGGESSVCDASAPCTFRWVDTFGFVTIPFMAACGFLGVAGLALLSLRSAR